MIAIGCDHGGFALKQEVMRHLDELGLAYKDFGTYSEESCDYPIYGEAVARAVADGENQRHARSLCCSMGHVSLPKESPTCPWYHPPIGAGCQSGPRGGAFR